MNNFVIYKHTLKSDGRVYIGQTKDVGKRWKPRYYSGSPHFYSAIKKYGWDSFDHEVVLCGLSLNEANVYEELLIDQYDATNPRHGFNLKSGGLNNNHSESTKRKIQESMKRVASSEDFRRHQSKMHDDVKKKVVCIETNVVYESIADAGRKTGLYYGSIGKCCNGKLKSTGGLHWRFVK